MVLLKHRAGRIKRGSRGQDLNQHRKGEAPDREMLNLRGCERWGRGSSVMEGVWMVWKPELAFSSLPRAGLEGAVAALSAQHRGKFSIPCRSCSADFPEQAARIWQRWVSTALP